MTDTTTPSTQRKRRNFFGPKKKTRRAKASAQPVPHEQDLNPYLGPEDWR